MTATVLRTDDGGVTELVLNRPERRNALSTELLRQLRDELRDLADSPSARAVVLSGAGPAFCAGADLTEFSDTSTERPRLARLRLVGEVVRLLRSLEQPTIAVVHGAVYGAGWGLALGCDLTYAAEDATFCLPEVTKGLRLPPVITARLVEVVGPVRAAEIVLAGEKHDAAAGLAAGWVARSLPDRAAAQELADRRGRELARQSHAATAQVKQVLRSLAAGPVTPPPEHAWNEETP